MYQGVSLVRKFLDTLNFQDCEYLRVVRRDDQTSSELFTIIDSISQLPNAVSVQDVVEVLPGAANTIEILTQAKPRQSCFSDQMSELSCR